MTSFVSARGVMPEGQAPIEVDASGGTRAKVLCTTQLASKEDYRRFITRFIEELSGTL
jgi:hypothetical protein